MALWASGALLQLGLLLAQQRRLRGRVLRAAPVEDAAVRGLFAELRSALGVGAPVRLLASPEVRTPQVVGLLRPAVLLPAAAAGRLSPDELALTLGHELLHLRRRDLWLGWVPALAQRLFFFHPLVHLAAREYAVAREAACDAAVLRVLAPAPEVYGRLLLKLGVTPGLPRLAAAGGSPSYRTLKRRLTMLQNASQPRRIHPAVWCLVAVGAAAALVPFRMVAEDRAAEATPAQPATAAFQTAQRATPPTPPRPPIPPTPPTPPKQDVRVGGGGEPWIAFLGDGHVAMNGSTRDIDRARQLLGGQEQGIWFERDGRSYLIRDAALTRQVQALFQPQTDLGKQQAALGEQQAKLGERQAKLGAEAAGIGAKMAELGAQIASVAAQQVHGGDDEDPALDAKMEELDRQMEKLDDEMEKFEAPMEELGRQQEALGERQGELGEQQEEAAEKAEVELRRLLDKALADGTAQPAR